jgi:hypothetical protein
MDGSEEVCQLPSKNRARLHERRRPASRTPNKWVENGMLRQTRARLRTCMSVVVAELFFLANVSSQKLVLSPTNPLVFKSKSSSLSEWFLSLLNHIECAPQLLQQIREFCPQQRLLGVNYHIDANVFAQAVRTNCLAQAAFHAVSVYRPAERAAHGKSNAWAARCRSPQVKHGEVRCEMTLALLVHAVKVSMPQ